MTLISSISGIRGTVNGPNSTNLTPIDVVKYASAYGTWVNKRNKNKAVSYTHLTLPTILLV